MLVWVARSCFQCDEMTSDDDRANQWAERRYSLFYGFHRLGINLWLVACDVMEFTWIRGLSLVVVPNYHEFLSRREPRAVETNSYKFVAGGMWRHGIHMNSFLIVSGSAEFIWIRESSRAASGRDEFIIHRNLWLAGCDVMEFTWICNEFIWNCGWRDVTSWNSHEFMSPC